MPTEAAPVEEMSHDSVPGAPTGIAAMMAQLDQASATGKTIVPGEKLGTPAPEPKPDSPASSTPKPDGKPATPPAAAAKPTTAPAPPKPGAEVKPPQSVPDSEPDWSKAPRKWHDIYQDHKSKTSAKITALETKLKSLESKPFEQAGDAKKIEAYEKQLSALRSESDGYQKKLAEKDFTQTKEYKRNFVEPANRIYKEAVGFVSRLRVKDGDEVRPATNEDFDYVRSLQGKARKVAALEIFGEDAASDVLDYVKDIDRIKLSATIAAEQHAEAFEAKSLENEGRTKQEKQQYDDFKKSALEGIQENETYGKWFKEDESDPEASQLLRGGYEEIEKVTAQLDSLPLDQQAAYSATFLARAAATPRLMLEVNRLQAKYDAAIEELEKIRGGDPGAEGHQAAGGGAPNGQAKRMGIDEAAAQFDQAPR